MIGSSFLGNILNLPNVTFQIEVAKQNITKKSALFNSINVPMEIFHVLSHGKFQAVLRAKPVSIS